MMVVGMHRSGTSLITRLLNIAGADLGDQSDLLPADSGNLSGFWESKSVIAFNEKLLEILGGSSYDPPLRPPGWVERDDVRAVSEHAKAFLSQTFGGSPLWAIKDPRISVLLPFWQSLIEEPKYVLCIRNPLAVAASMAKRDLMTFPQVSVLWHVYTLRALADTEGTDRIVAFYEDVMRDPYEEAERIYKYVGTGVGIDDPGVRASIGSYVSKGLTHHNPSEQDLLESSDVLTITKNLYRAIVVGDQATLSTAIKEAEGTFELLHAVTSALGSAWRIKRDFADVQNKLDLASAELQYLHDILNSRGHRLVTSVRKGFSRLQGRGSDADSTPT